MIEFGLGIVFGIVAASYFWLRVMDGFMGVPRRSFKDMLRSVVAKFTGPK